MPTVITGRDLALTIDSKAYDAQATSVTLTTDVQRETYQTLDGKVRKTIDSTGTLAVELLADWGAASSLCEAMWTAANTSPDTALAFSLTAVTGAVFTGTAFPSFPVVSGTAPDAQTVSLSLEVAAVPTGTFS
mgnify:CR=1 FL=1|jgi:hypothetical protein